MNDTNNNGNNGDKIRENWVEFQQRMPFQGAARSQAKNYFCLGSQRVELWLRLKDARTDRRSGCINFYLLGFVPIAHVLSFFEDFYTIDLEDENGRGIETIGQR